MNEITVIDTNALAQVTGGYKVLDITNIKNPNRPYVNPWTGTSNVHGGIHEPVRCTEQV